VLNADQGRQDFFDRLMKIDAAEAFPG